MTEENEVHVSVENLTKFFPVSEGGSPFGRKQRKLWVHAVDGVSLQIHHGECFSLVGESGSGKTTIANCIIGAFPPTKGTIHLGDTLIASDGKLPGPTMRQRARRIQMVFQDPTSALNPRMTIGHALGEPLRVHHVATGQEAQAHIARVLERVGLPASTAELYPHQLNTSQRQRVVIARALTLEPEVVIADEPIAKLDVSMQGQILNLLGDLQRDLGLTVLFITHDLTVVRQVADRVAVLYLGQLMEIAAREEFFDPSVDHHPYSRALLRSTPRLRTTAAQHDIYTIHGEIPSPIDVPPGCPFLSRCPEGDESCARGRPPLVSIAPGVIAACWKRDRYGEASESEASPSDSPG